MMMSNTEKDLLRTFLMTLLQLENVERGSVWVKKGQHYICIEAIGDQSDRVKGLRIDVKTQSIVGWVIENGKMTISRPGDDGRHYSEIESDLDIKSTVILCFPLVMRNGELYGAIQLIDTSMTGERIDLRREYLDLIENLVHIGSIALSNLKDYHVQLSENEKLSKTIDQLKGESLIIGKSPSFLEVLDKAREYAKVDFPVLITGESGTGKEVLAREIYRLSTRNKRPYLVQNCSAIPETLLESELFGHRKGAFTGAVADKKGLFEAADKGMLFLDEIGDMPFHLQARILRVIQNGEIKPLGGNTTTRVNVRIISATHVDLEKAVKENRFREDLFYRLNVLPIQIPPLRERKIDIPLLLDYFINRECHRLAVKPKSIAPDAMDVLANYTWPGNIREMENFVRQIIVTTKSGSILRSDLPKRIANVKKQDPSLIREQPPQELSKTESNADIDTKRVFKSLTWENLDKIYIDHLLNEYKWNISRAAKAAGLNRSTFNSRLRKLGIRKSS